MPTIELFSKNNFNLSEYDSEVNGTGPANLNGAQNLGAPNDTVCINPQNPQAPEPVWVIPLLVSYTPRGYVGPALAAGCTGFKLGDSSDSGLVGDTLSVGCEDSTFYNIQEAVDYAEDGDTIEVCDGTYDYFFVESKSLTITAREGHSPVIDLTSSDWGINFDGSGVWVFSGFEIFSPGDGVRAAIEVSEYYGGDASVDFSDLDIHDSKVGIAVSWSGSALDISISDSHLYNNSEQGMNISLDSGDGYSSYTVNLDGVQVYGNSGKGIAISTDEAIINFNDTVAYDNGDVGIYVSARNRSSSINLENIEAYGNSGPGMYIGGDEETVVTASNLNLHDNGNSTISGGGISISGGQISISDSTIRDNIASWGGGIYLEWGVLTLIDTSVKDNVATDSNMTSGGLQLHNYFDQSSSVTAYGTSWAGSNEPYDVSAHNPEDTPYLDLLYNYGSNADFYCEYLVGCSDL